MLEIAKLVALLLCVLSLCVLFWAIFMDQAGSVDQRIWSLVELFAVSTSISVAAGLIFRQTERPHRTELVATLPMQIFLWGVGLMAVLLLAARYLETHVVFYRDVRRY